MSLVEVLNGVADDDAFAASFEVTGATLTSSSSSPIVSMIASTLASY